MKKVPFYDDQSEEYFAATAQVDPSAILAPLVKRLTAGALVLDVGCGSGRDLRWLRRNGFRAEGLEGAPNLAGLARAFSGCPVTVGDFTVFDFSSFQADGLLLIGALVHVLHDEMAVVLGGILRALKPGGWALVSQKEGEGERVHEDGRVFRLWREEELRRIYAGLGLDVAEFHRSVSRIRESDVWLTHLLRKEGA